MDRRNPCFSVRLLLWFDESDGCDDNVNANGNTCTVEFSLSNFTLKLRMNDNSVVREEKGFARVIERKYSGCVCVCVV